MRARLQIYKTIRFDVKKVAILRCYSDQCDTGSVLLKPRVRHLTSISRFGELLKVSLSGVDILLYYFRTPRSPGSTVVEQS